MVVGREEHAYRRVGSRSLRLACGLVAVGIPCLPFVIVCVFEVLITR